jgi:superfamily II DNA or RNA helicase
MLVEELARLFTAPNPEYLTASKYSPWGSISADIPPTISFHWTDEDGAMCIPRGVSPRMLSKKAMKEFYSYEFEDQRTSAKIDFPKPLLTPNEEQAALLDNVKFTRKQNLRPFGNYLVLASTATGKTILQALIARYFRQRTMVICPTDLVVIAWQNDLAKLFGFAPEDIGLIKQSVWRIGAHFTIASAKTLSKRRERWDELDKTFGTLVVDEAQNIAAPYLFNYVSQASFKYLVGATATESSSGRPNSHLRAVLGEPVGKQDAYHAETATSMPISAVTTLHTNFRYTYQSDNLDWHDFALAMASDAERNEQIVAAAKKDWLEGRSVLVTTRNLEHVNVLKCMLKEAGVENVNEISGRTNSSKKHTRKLMDAIIARKTRCQVGTVSAVKEGANVPVWDCLHITMPIAAPGNLEQLLGRIRRKAEGKKTAVVTYYLDIKVPYALGILKRTVIPVFRQMKIPGYQNLFIA